MVGLLLRSSLRRNPFAENQQSTIWSNFWNRTCWQRRNRDGKEVALQVKEQVAKARLGASEFKEVQWIYPENRIRGHFI